MTGHTPGPWRLSGPDEFGDYTIQPPDEELAIACVVNGAWNALTGHDEKHAANARLIAAAPDTARQRDELADALELALATMKVHVPSKTHPALEAARTALKNAGRQP